MDTPFSEVERGISIIIPTRNREELFFDTLYHLNIGSVTTVLNKPVEVIVVFDGELYEDIPKKDFIEYIQINHKGFRPSMIRNIGAAASHYDQLIFLDDDCLPNLGWLRSYYDSFEKDKILFGKVDYWKEDLSEKSQSDPRFNECTNPNFLPVWTGNFSVSREIFFKVGGFHPNFDKEGFIGEGTEFSMRAKAFGAKIRFVEGAKVIHRGEYNGKSSQRLKSSDPSKETFSRLSAKW